MSLSQTIDDLRAELASSPFGDLPLWARLTLWRAMEAEFPRDGGLRRSYLALFVLNQMLPAWDRANMPLPYRDLPHLLHLAAKLYLSGVTARESVVSIRSACSDAHQYLVCACDWETYGDVAFVQFAAEYVADRVLGADDEDYQLMELYDEVDLPNTSERPTEFSADPVRLWDAHFIGSIMAANGAHWEADRCNNDARREYWCNWLNEWFPQFVGDLEIAQAAAKCGTDYHLPRQR